MGSATTVIGLGNPLMADDGTGVSAIRRLGREWSVPDDVQLVDGGTWGMNLLPLIEDAGRLLLLDAIDQGQAPGALIRLADGEIPRALAMKLSPHQIDLSEVLAVAALRGRLPSRMIALGLQPERVIFEPWLSPVIEERIGALVEAAVGQLAQWGHHCATRPSVASV